MKPIDCINEAKRLLDLRHQMARQMRLTGCFWIEVHCRDGAACQVRHGDGGASHGVEEDAPPSRNGHGTQKRLDKAGGTR